MPHDGTTMVDRVSIKRKRRQPRWKQEATGVRIQRQNTTHLPPIEMFLKECKEALVSLLDTQINTS